MKKRLVSLKNCSKPFGDTQKDSLKWVDNIVWSQNLAGSSLLTFEGLSALDSYQISHHFKAEYFDIYFENTH